MCCIMAKARKHFDFDEMEEYLRNKTYPSTIPARDYRSKSNFRRATKRYKVKDGHLFYEKRLVIKGKEHQMEIIRDMHQSIGDCEHSKREREHGQISSDYRSIFERGDVSAWVL